MEKVGMGMAEVAMEKVMAASTVVVTAGSLAAAKTERVRAATTVKAVRAPPCPRMAGRRPRRRRLAGVPQGPADAVSDECEWDGVSATER